MGRFTFCRICGYQNFDDAKVCKGCGATLRGATSSDKITTLLPPPPPLICPTSCTISVAVHPDFRRRGIGTALIERALEEARNRAIETAYTSTFMDNIAMQKLAEKVGFIKYVVIERDGLQFPRYKRKV